ncbi:MAG TPA: hypothetical protein VMH27_03155 [Puia sp.]|nr:hypothetical protein [Puia sp.]
MAIFSGYPLIWSFARAAMGKRPSEGSLRGKLAGLLPFAYALLGTLYLGLQGKNLYPDYSIGHISWVMRQNYLQVWGLLAILFWLPALRNRPALSLFHSLLFVFFLVADLVRQYFNVGDGVDRVRNDMTVYTVSIVLDLGMYALVILFSTIYIRYRDSRGTGRA